MTQYAAASTASETKSAMHNAGGKGRMPLLPGVTGNALFAGTCHEHRLVLNRDRAAHGGLAPLPFALWCGMNPSTAGADDDDLTARKEQEWTSRMSLSRYVKVNFGSYRSTDPKGLSAPGIQISHPCNLLLILHLAQQAHTVVMACGNPPASLLPHAYATVHA